MFCQEFDEFIDVEEDTEEGKMNYRKRHGAPLGVMGNSRVSRRFRLLFCERVRARDGDHAFRLQLRCGDARRLKAPSLVDGAGTTLSNRSGGFCTLLGFPFYVLPLL